VAMGGILPADPLLALRLVFFSAGKVKSFTPHGTRAAHVPSLSEKPLVLAVPLNRRTAAAAPNKLAARGWKQKTPTIVPPWREDGAGPIFPRFSRVVARSSWVAFAQLSTQ
jgi:hypothetical protein